VWNVGWSPGGAELASVSGDLTGDPGGDNSLRIWNITTGDLVYTIGEQTSPIWSIAWSPNDGRVATGSNDHIIRLWDPAGNALIGTLEEHTAPVWSLAWSPTGQQLASSTGDLSTPGSVANAVWLWNVASGDFTVIADSLAMAPVSISWSADGRRLAAVSLDGQVYVWPQ
jgi:WD40 repeat protein